jgi:hypothetical protein
MRKERRDMRMTEIADAGRRKNADADQGAEKETGQGEADTDVTKGADQDQETETPTDTETTPGTTTDRRPAHHRAETPHLNTTTGQAKDQETTQQTDKLNVIHTHIDPKDTETQRENTESVTAVPTAKPHEKEKHTHRDPRITTHTNVTQTQIETKDNPKTHQETPATAQRESVTADHAAKPHVRRKQTHLNKRITKQTHTNTKTLRHMFTNKNRLRKSKSPKTNHLPKRNKPTAPKGSSTKVQKHQVQDEEVQQPEKPKQSKPKDPNNFPLMEVLFWAEQQVLPMHTYRAPDPNCGLPTSAHVGFIYTIPLPTTTLKIYDATRMILIGNATISNRQTIWINDLFSSEVKPFSQVDTAYNEKYGLFIGLLTIENDKKIPRNACTTIDQPNQLQDFYLKEKFIIYF